MTSVLPLKLVAVPIIYIGTSCCCNAEERKGYFSFIIFFQYRNSMFSHVEVKNRQYGTHAVKANSK